jgi:ATP-dependent helicase/nuclease subunit A
MQFTPNQRIAIERPGHLLVEAGAGSGKTRVLVERYLQLLLAEAGHTSATIAVERILAITFTEKAAREMRERVRETIEQRARAAGLSDRAFWEELLAVVEAARVGTIHSFCADLLRAQPAETGIDPHFGILDEVQAGLLIDESIDETLRAAVADPQTSELLAEFAPDELRALLSGLLRGGGETRAAIAATAEDPDRLVSDWYAQIDSVRRRAWSDLQADPDWVAAADLLLARAATAPPNDKLSEQVRAVATWLQGLTGAAPADFRPIDEIRLNVGSKKAWGAAELDDVRAALRSLRESYRRERVIFDVVPDPDLDLRMARAISAVRRLFQQADRAYRQRKSRIDMLDFDDLERRARELLEQHPELRRRWHAELRTVLVDEFQDTNDDQRAIVYALAGLALNESTTAVARPDLFVVGDGKQSIYRFRGADVSVFRRVRSDLEERQVVPVSLNTSFRSNPTLLAWINRLSAALFARPHELQPFEFPFEALESARAAPDHRHCVEWHIIAEHESVEALRMREAQVVVQRIKALAEDRAGRIVYDPLQRRWRAPGYGEIALLFQASTSFEIFEEALRNAGIPFLTTAGRGYYGRKEVQDLMHLLRVLDDPNDDLALVGLLRSPMFAIDDATILDLRRANRYSLRDALIAVDPVGDTPLQRAWRLLDELFGLRGRLSVVELLRTALAQSGYLATISGLNDGARRRANVEKLLAAARLAGSRGLRAFSEYLDQLLRTETREGEAPLEADDSVRLMTVHRSKGLEFPVVLLPDLGRRAPPLNARWLARRAYGVVLQTRAAADESQLPAGMLIARRIEAAMERAERERLLYVGLTRAKDYLILSGPPPRSGGEDWQSRVATALGVSSEAQFGEEDRAPLRIFRHAAAEDAPV